MSILQRETSICVPIKRFFGRKIEKYNYSKGKHLDEYKLVNNENNGYIDN